MLIKVAWFTFAILGLLSFAGAELYFVSVPRSLELAKSTNTLNLKDVPQVINYLMGLPSHMETSWQGVLHADVFNRPKANLLINIYIPSGLKFNLAKYTTKYEIQNADYNQFPSIEETNTALNQIFSQWKPMIVDFESDGQLLSTAQQNAKALDGLPVTLEMMRERLSQGDSLLSSLETTSCLTSANEPDAFFYGELQTMSDILAKLQLDRSSVDDKAQDSFYFVVNALDGLSHAYGADSCQVKTALHLLENFIPRFIDSFNTLYRGKLLAEVNIVGSVQRSFDQAKIRRVRSLQETTAAPPTDELKGVVLPLPSDYPVTVNLTFWVFVVFSLATLVTSYGIWMMDPGWDSVIYRMTPNRVKLD